MQAVRNGNIDLKMIDITSSCNRALNTNVMILAKFSEAPKVKL